MTIPVIARFGNLEAKAAIANVKLTHEAGKPAVNVQLTRNGDRSTFGEVRVMKAGIKDPDRRPARHRRLHRDQPAQHHDPG